MRVCARCGAEVDHAGTIGRNNTCSNCGAYLHSCVNCRFYRPGRHNDCTEPQAELVADKRAANFCNYFTMREARGSEPKPAGNKRDKARKDFDKLFGG
ncbi:MAG: hypothetical protein KAS61_01635 [Spirochaetes bacterium]|nr:hypothetical protein [Spirochaetota bacterium]